ncbi:MAG: lipopolysaccharide heptosyltransferase I [Pseudomonadota bacterium]
MRVLIVKTSSLGDVLHTLPALSDAARAVPGIRFDWLVEEAFAEIPVWHPAVDRVIPVAVRRWRQNPLQGFLNGEYKNFLRALRARRYDKIIDAQGLIKSALLSCMARGVRGGLDSYSAREPWAAWAYQENYAVPKGQHAIQRVRQLCAASLGYTLPENNLDYGVERARFSPYRYTDRYMVFLHGTTWRSKQWPETYWMELARLAQQDGFTVRLPWGNEAERLRAARIAQACPGIQVLPRMNLTETAAVLAGAQGVVGVDSGLAHLAAALAVPGVTLYGATQPGLTGTLGAAARHLRAEFGCSPCMQRRCTYRGASDVTPACYQTIPPAKVWETAAALMNTGEIRAHAH